MDIFEIKNLVQNGQYHVRLYALQHALKEGFSERDMVQAVTSGKIVETYPERMRVLICGRTTIDDIVELYLRVVCEYRYDDVIDLVTAYIPNKLE